MERVLLLLEHRGNRRLLAELLSRNEQVVAAEPQALPEEPFDLCIVDSVALPRLWQQLGARKRRERPAFLPILLVTARHDVGVGTRRLWENVDELISSPIEKAELRARVEILLRARRLSRENEALRRQLEAELERAARVQAALLPETTPAVAGGDFYDWHEPVPGTLVLTLGDVCGKGMPAALLMATIRASLRAVSPTHPPAAAIRLVERALASDLERSGSFVTLFHAHLATADRRVTYADAGHGYSFVRRRDGRVEELDTRGMPLGAFPDEEYRDGTVTLAAGRLQRRAPRCPARPHACALRPGRCDRRRGERPRDLRAPAALRGAAADPARRPDDRRRALPGSALEDGRRAGRPLSRRVAARLRPRRRGSRRPCRAGSA
jgi:CheY-like chemotaxis protein